MPVSTRTISFSGGTTSRKPVPWWKAFSAGVPRDQLCLQPIFLRHGIHPALLLGKGLNARNVPFLKYTLHPPTGKENAPGRVTWGNFVYRIRLGWRKLMLLFLK